LAFTTRYAMTQEWITDRPPTEADGDGDGDVRARRRPSLPSAWHHAHWSCVGAGACWQRTSYWQPHTEPTSTEPTPTEPDRIAALEQRVAKLLRDQDELIAAMANRLKSLESLEQLFWAHKHEAQPVSIPAEAQP
jgi:hypothetical protein